MSFPFFFFPFFFTSRHISVAVSPLHRGLVYRIDNSCDEGSMGVDHQCVWLRTLHNNLFLSCCNFFITGFKEQTL